MSASTQSRVPAAYDPLDPVFQVDPYPAYRSLRDTDPVHRHLDPPYWALSRFDDVWTAVRDVETFSSAQGLTFHPDEIGTLNLAPTMVMLDPPRHTQLRALVGKAFTPKRVAELEDAIRGFVRGRITEFERVVADGGAVDLHRDFSSLIPTFVLSELLGVDEANRARFGPWVRAIVQLQDSGFAIGEMKGPEAVAEMFGYFSEVIKARRHEPGDDLISALTLAEVDGEQLSDWDILGFCFVIVAGGIDMITNASDARFGLLGARFVGEETLNRFYVLHCVAIPLAAALLIAIHFWRVRKDGGISGPL